ncbi:MAG: phosphatase PAP2 family protein [Actinomycetota bacterium]|jgi:undecaprenyl-diphosphatase|nr:phosphatase PAP2 family protein [Actinomycetota bacterium]
MSSFVSRVDQLDERLDALFEPLRNSRPLVYVFNTSSAVGDFGAIWHVIGVVGALNGALSWSQAIVLALLMGAESLLLNQGVKRLFRRTRPTAAGDDRFTVRRPLTSSFPSGHASSAFFAAVVLSGWVDVGWTTTFFVFAVVIALSRVVVRIHHVSDIVVGSVVGALLGTIALQFTASVA